MEEYIPHGNIALVRAADYFNFEKHRAFIAYAAVVIRNEISQYRLMRRIIPTTDAAEHEIIDDHEDPYDRDMHIRDSREYLDKLLSRLDKRGQRLIRLHYGFCSGGPLTFRELSNHEGISQSAVNRAHLRAVDQLKETAMTGGPPSNKPWKPIGSKRPDEFASGPLVGPLEKIAVAVFGGSLENAYQKLESSCRRLEIWIAKAPKALYSLPTGVNAFFEAWFRSESEFAAATGTAV